VSGQTDLLRLVDALRLHVQLPRGLPLVRLNALIVIVAWKLGQREDFFAEIVLELRATWRVEIVLRMEPVEIVLLFILAEDRFGNALLVV